MVDDHQRCPLSETQIQAAYRELASGSNLDPPREQQCAWARAGDLDVLVERHYWLLVALARQRVERGLGMRPTDDAHAQARYDRAIRLHITAGHRGLLLARDCWDHDRGYKFGTLASQFIRQAMTAKSKPGRRNEFDDDPA